MNDKERADSDAYARLFGQVARMLFQADPIGINFGDNTDEYAPETGTILPRLKDAASEPDVLQIVHEEFVRWFGEGTAGPRARYELVARDLWRLWQGNPLRSRGP